MMWVEIPAIAPGRLGCASLSEADPANLSAPARRSRALPRDAPASASPFLSEDRDDHRRQGAPRRRRANYVLHGER